ncbi:ribonuclease H-like domain-containing protein [Tanacetum coccineum]
MVEKPVLNKKGRVTGQREIRPVWNNAQRVNHQNKFTHPHPKRNFVPTSVVTKSGQVPVNTAKQSSPRAAASISTARPVNTAAPKSKVNDALPKTYSYFKAHSPVRRAFNQKSAAKTNNLNEKVKTARVNNVTTAGSKAVVNAAVGNGENAVKSSACWIWRPTGNVIDHTSKDSGSYMLKRFDYGNPQYTLQDQGIFDSGCSRHMTGNKSFLTDYQEIDGGFVAFGGSPKGGKITGKGKIRTGKLDFEDVYFVKELKFNLFSVSQMCDKKNSVLFTETECLVLSPDFKLLDESQVLLKVPRHDNMYSFDLKNVVPSGVTAGNHTNRNASIKDNVDALPTQQYIFLPLLYDSPQSSKDAVADDAGDQNVQDFRAALDNLLVQQKKGYANSTNRDSTASPSVSAAGRSFTNINDLPIDPLMPDLEDIANLLNTGIFSGAYDNEDEGAKADLNKLETTMNVSPIPTNRIYKDHPKEQIIRDPLLAPQTRRMTKFAQEYVMKVWRLVDLPKGKHAIGTKWVYKNKKDERGIVVRNNERMVVQGYTQEEGIDYDEMDVKRAFLYGTIEKEVYVCQPPSFEDPQFPDKVKQKDDGIFISQDKYVADILKKFDFVTMKIASTPIETNKALLKDEEAEDIDVHLYKSMIRSLMYLTASRIDIMFAVCACTRDSPFDLEAFFDSDYVGASLERKSTIGGCQFLGKSLISWQCKKQTIVANSTTKAEYVAAANCYGH